MLMTMGVRLLINWDDKLCLKSPRLALKTFSFKLGYTELSSLEKFSVPNENDVSAGTSVEYGKITVNKNLYDISS